MKRSYARAGFTLLELMMAVTILGLVMTVVYGTWSAGITGWKRSSAISAEFQRERVVMEALNELTSSIVCFTSGNGNQIYALQGVHDEENGDSVSFVTSSDAALPQTESSIAGMRRVTLYLTRDPQGKPFLAIMNAPALQPPDASTEGETHAFSANVIGFGVRYRDLSENWVDAWDTPGILPSAIEYTVAFPGADRRSPPIIMTRAIEIPVALTIMREQSMPANQNPTTNQVERQDIPLMQPTETESP